MRIIYVAILVGVSIIAAQAAPKACPSVVIHPLLHVAKDADESEEVSSFVEGMSFTCPNGTHPVDTHHLVHDHMTYKDILNADAQLECKP